MHPSRSGSWNKRSGIGADGPSTMSHRVASNDLAESYMSFNSNYHDAGLFGMYGIGPRDKTDDLAWCMMQEFPRMCFDVSEAEVTRAKNTLKTMMIFSSDGPSGDSNRRTDVHSVPSCVSMDGL